MTLYHYACSHTVELLGSPARLLPAWEHAPNTRGLPHSRWLWLTDLATPDTWGLGLTGLITRCDRTEYRYEITEHGLVVPWTSVRRSMPPEIREDLEGAPGALPRHWFVTEDPAVGVLSDPR